MVGRLTPQWVAIVAALWLCSIGAARASNGNLPRTPVIHQNETCMTVVDPAITPVLHLPYTIPFGDTCLTEDELPDNRTHQFLAWCRTWPAWEQTPHWLTGSDVERSIEHGILPQAPPASDVVEGQADLEGCLARIDDDDERREIHCTTAIDGVDWDVAAAAPGAWVVYGYTFDPPLNLWVPRRGVVKIEGPLDAPAAALAPHETVVGSDAPLLLEACVDAPAGSTLRASWAFAAGVEWHVFAEVDDVGDGTYPLELPNPADAGTGDVIVLRVEIVAPDGSTFAYDSPDEVSVIEQPAPTSGGMPTPFDFCTDNPTALDPQDCGDDGGDQPEGGCGCASTPADSRWALLLVLGAALRGRYTRGRGPRCRSDGT